MTVAATLSVVHVAFDERFKFGTPYPSGVALMSALLTGDATGGIIQLTVEAPSGFIYRLEHCHVQHNVASVIDRGASIELVHGWATERTGLARNFSVVHELEKTGPGATTNLTYAPQAGDYQSMRHFPVGRTDLSLLGNQVIAEMKVHVNVNTSGNVFTLGFTYWPLSATYRAGFLSSFYEAPVVPPAV